MADPTREQTVTANVTAAETKYGKDNYIWIFMQILKDINITLAKLLDK